MKIGIAGAHGTGKTTLAEALAKKLGLPLITEQAREAAKELGYKTLDELMTNPEKAYEFQKLVIAKQLYQEITHLNTGFVSDRTIIDNYAYWCMYGLDRFKVATGIIKAIDFDRLYDYIVYVPIEFSVKNDGFRFVCEGCRRFIDRIIREELNKLAVTRVVTVSGTTEERLGQIIDFIKKNGI